jgi:hypothetical protein
MKKYILIVILIYTGFTNVSFAQNLANWRTENTSFNNYTKVIIHPLNVKKHKFEGKNGIILSNEPQSNIYSDIQTQNFKIKFEFIQDQNGKAFFKIAENLKIVFNVGFNQNFGSIWTNQELNVFPNANAEKTPGLWQKIEVIFITNPRLGKSIIEQITLNDLVIHSNLILENAIRPSKIGFENETGVFGFKNFVFDAFENSKPVELQNLNYVLEETHGWDKTFEPKGTDKITDKIETLTNDFPKTFEKYKLTYSGQLNVKKSNIYTFTIDYQGLVYFKVDGKEIIASKEYSFRTPLSAQIELTQGVHEFEYKYQNIFWRPVFGLALSGIGFRPYSLNAPESLPEPPLVGGVYIEKVSEKTKLIRSFINFKTEKRTSVLTVGSPQNIHYAFDLDNGAILYAWKGQFADLTEMWFERGEPQVISPLGLKVRLSGLKPFVDLKNKNLAYKLESYKLDKNGSPVFNYLFDNEKIIHSFEPINNTLKCNVEFDSKNMQTFILDEGLEILKLDDGLYKIDDHYLQVNTKSKAVIIDSEGSKRLISNAKKSISYSLIW